VEGKALRIEGGNFVMAEMRTFHCNDCAHTWQEPFGTGRPARCPACNSQDFCRAGGGHGKGRGCHGGGCRRRRGHSHRASKEEGGAAA
jgi:hypothetical protein